MLGNKLNTITTATYCSIFNTAIFHVPFFSFVFRNIDYYSLAGIFTVTSLLLTMLVANFLVFFIFLSASTRLGKTLISLFFIINALAVYFVNTYSVIVDESMIGNVFNTNYEEASSFYALKLLVYLLILGVLPAFLLSRIKIKKVDLKKSSITALSALAVVAFFVFANSSSWLWIDKHSKTLGGLAMPWSYTVNSIRYYSHESQKNQKEILLPSASFKNNEKAVMVLVIGESARSANFSLYGYAKDTNPLLSKTENLHHFKANSCATYTTAGVKCILEHANTEDLYEILPNYLYRNGVEVFWRTTNWGEPNVHIKNYQNKEYLKKYCQGGDCGYDELLLGGLKTEVEKSRANKILIVLHTSTSHGPSYNKKYPANFEKFKPVCNSVELKDCNQQELINAYDNTIVYTDYILHSLIDTLNAMKDYKSAMLFVSDHGESLGEKNLYMHGIPISLAPKEQYEIPFLVWTSSNANKTLKPEKLLTQNYVFHSVLNFLDINSPVYNEKLNIFIDR
ncbi:phosphoethanolamine--lipid A transferase EptA [Pelobium manganitolerans]|uniref:phosphoethanolamine--lipid A transferase EptA n=1 Tax=Pelobium manganitolerans TaxID=1842495 RepID=UPI003FA3C954